METHGKDKDKTEWTAIDEQFNMAIFNYDHLEPELHKIAKKFQELARLLNRELSASPHHRRKALAALDESRYEALIRARYAKF